uniref:Uncharacterized protein n=1 Tax=Cucumis sativus TaxID=3659 RepID=A0A0A0L2C3_CUCSA
MAILGEKWGSTRVTTRGRSASKGRKGGGGRARTAEGFNGGTQTTGSRSNLISGIGEGIWSVDGMRRIIEKRGGIGKGKIGFSFRATEGYGSVVVSTGGVFCGIEGA